MDQYNNILISGVKYTFDAHWRKYYFWPSVNGKSSLQWKEKRNYLTPRSFKKKGTDRRVLSYWSPCLIFVINNIKLINFLWFLITSVKNSLNSIIRTISHQSSFQKFQFFKTFVVEKSDIPFWDGQILLTIQEQSWRTREHRSTSRHRRKVNISHQKIN